MLLKAVALAPLLPVEERIELSDAVAMVAVVQGDRMMGQLLLNAPTLPVVYLLRSAVQEASNTICCCWWQFQRCQW
jgi:hypothetical protein